MAEGFAKHFGGSEVKLKSAGTKPALFISSKGTQAMAEE